jgi:SAM-dependent methyltransferase
MSFNINAEFDPACMTLLCSIMSEKGSDKGGRHKEHNYTTFYFALLAPRREHPLRIFELGLGTNNLDVASNMGAYGVPGASLRGWATFCPNALVYGADIDARILFTEDRIQTYYCDQTDPASIATLWDTDCLRADFDVIVEDGLHSYDANACFLANSLHKLAPGGVYIVEDIAAANVPKLAAFAAGLIARQPEFVMKILQIPHPSNTSNNNILVIKRQEP